MHELLIIINHYWCLRRCLVPLFTKQWYHRFAIGGQDNLFTVQLHMRTTRVRSCLQSAVNVHRCTCNGSRPKKIL